MLELWRPPRSAGDPVGCLATTYTFDPGLFDEQCLARFLEIDSEPNREDLAFLLERETRLGSVYAGVLVDHSHAGVEHSLRWDVLPVRIPGNKQHAKISILVWSNQVRVVIASANLTEPGYRTNHEVAGTIEAGPDNGQAPAISDCCEFLEALLTFVPAASPDMPEIRRATDFLGQVRRKVGEWAQPRRRGRLNQYPVFTLPAAEGGSGLVSSTLDRCIELCRRFGRSPSDAWIASPFFDIDGEEWDLTTAALCKAMARGRNRAVTFCVPGDEEEENAGARLAAPIGLLRTARHYADRVSIETLPHRDDDKNLRPWHAKLLGLSSDSYNALLTGSSNFTSAGMGMTAKRNAEANLLYIAERAPHAREPRQLDELWPDTRPVEGIDAAEWLGPQEDLVEEQQGEIQALLPWGFQCATYVAGDDRRIVLRFEPAKLPQAWEICACGHEAPVLSDRARYDAAGQPRQMDIPWRQIQPPEKLLVRWDSYEAFWPLNVDDARRLPPPAKLDQMSADDMLMIVAASDPGGAFRAWAKRKATGQTDFEEDLDSAAPPDLDPLRRYSLHQTFLHRVRQRAGVLAHVRQNLQRPVYSVQALQWRLYGLIGIERLAERVARDLAKDDGNVGEVLLTLSDLLIVLQEVQYQPEDSAVSAEQFAKAYRPFLADLAAKLDHHVRSRRQRLSDELLRFWGRVVQRCK